jgi:hypothetical protein
MKAQLLEGLHALKSFYAYLEQICSSKTPQSQGCTEYCMKVTIAHPSINMSISQATNIQVQLWKHNYWKVCMLWKAFPPAWNKSFARITPTVTATMVKVIFGILVSIPYFTGMEGTKWGSMLMMTKVRHWLWLLSLYPAPTIRYYHPAQVPWHGTSKVEYLLNLNVELSSVGGKWGCTNKIWVNHVLVSTYYQNQIKCLSFLAIYLV